MPTDHSVPYVRELMIFLVAAGIVVPLLHRFRISPVLGYLLIGCLIGPFGLGALSADFGWLQQLTIYDLVGVQRLAELGVVFLLFVIGLELSFTRLWSMRRMVFGLGSAQVLSCALAIFVVARVCGMNTVGAVLVGASFALSSTAIVMQLLGERRALGSALGRTSFSILLLQDLAVVPILFLVGVLSAGSGGGVGGSLLLALGKAALVMATIFFIGRRLLRPLMRLVAGTRSPEMFTAAILLIAIGSAMLTHAAGLSMALGAFLAGLLLAETEFRHQIEVEIDPFKGLLLGLFFISVGMGIDVRVLIEHSGPVMAGVVALMLGKAVLIGGLSLAFGVSRAVAIETGLLLAQAGEFAFVVIGMAAQATLIAPGEAQFVLMVASISMLLTPAVAALGRRIAADFAAKAAARQEHGEVVIAAHRGHVIIAGFGRVGRLLARVLSAEGLDFVALDLDVEHVARGRADGLPVHYGDASRLEVLRRAQLDDARVLVITMDGAAATEHIVRAVREFAPHLPIYVRARDGRHARKLLLQGASEVVPETVEASLQLAARVLSSTGMADEKVESRIEDERAHELLRLRESVLG